MKKILFLLLIMSVLIGCSKVDTKEGGGWVSETSGIKSKPTDPVQKTEVGVVTTTMLGIDENTDPDEVNEILASLWNTGEAVTVKLMSDLKIGNDTYNASSRVRRVHIDCNGFSIINDDPGTNFGFFRMREGIEYNIDAYIIENAREINRNIFRIDSNITFKIDLIKFTNNKFMENFRFPLGDNVHQLLLAMDEKDALDHVENDNFYVNRVIISDNETEPGVYIQAMYAQNTPIRYASFSRNKVFNLHTTIFGINHNNDLADVEDGNRNLYRMLADKCDTLIVDRNHVHWDGYYVSDATTYYANFTMHEGRNTIFTNNIIEGIATTQSFASPMYGQCTENYIFKDNIIKNIFMVGERDDDGVRSGYLFNSKVATDNIEIEGNTFIYDEFIYDRFDLEKEDTVVFRFNSLSSGDVGRYPIRISNIKIRNNTIKAYKMGYYAGTRLHHTFIVEGNTLETYEPQNLYNCLALRNPVMTGVDSLYKVSDNTITVLNKDASVNFETGIRTSSDSLADTTIDYVFTDNNLKLGSDTAVITWEGSDSGMIGLRSVSIKDNEFDVYGNIRLGNAQYAIPDKLDYDFIMTGNRFISYAEDGYNAINNQITLTTGVFELDNIWILPKVDRLWTQRINFFYKGREKDSTFTPDFINKIYCTSEISGGRYYSKKTSLLEIDTSGTSMMVGVREDSGDLVEYDYHSLDTNPANQQNYNEVTAASPFIGVQEPGNYRHQMIAGTTDLYYRMSSNSHSELATPGIKSVRITASSLAKNTAVTADRE